MIELKNLTFGYGKRKLFNNLNLKLEKAKVYGLLGLNGVGKTTLLKIILSALFPDDGEVLINGINSRKRSVEYLKNLFIVPEQFNIQPLKIKNFVKANAPLYPFFDYSKFENLISEFQLTVNQKLTELSSGQAKRFLLAFALSSQAKILLLDEPTNALDIPSKETFRKILISSINTESLIIISTHQVADIEGIIDNIIILDNGKVIFNQPIEQINTLLSQKTVPTSQIKNLKDKILYANPIFGGYNIIIPRENEDDPIVKIETLFNAVIKDHQKINNIFNNYNNA